MEDEDLNEAIRECAKIVEKKCKKRPYMIVISKANLGYASDEDKKKRLLKGNCTYMYYSKPPLGRDGVSRSLVDGAKAAIKMAEKKNSPEKNE
ncbi:hypothetical protein KKE92_02910 [Candidatus Micrarchaeota archaeon]|nr:hypothetical protein [Candidatus Micrarchaeota archaeon]MBU1681409.1 hypothetical protein [Candidatus Micrarchaeota archaeon]